MADTNFGLTEYSDIDFIKCLSAVRLFDKILLSF